MEHTGIIELETPRLRLRKFAAGDAQAMFDNWAGDPMVTKFLTWPAHGTVSDSAKIIALWVAEYDNADCYRWAITLKEYGDEPIGCIDVVDKDERINGVTIGYCLGREWWGRGIMSEAFAAVIRFLFDEAKVNRIEARHDVDNPASGKVMQKCGLKYEGTLRRSALNNRGDVVDTAVYGIIAGDRA